MNILPCDFSETEQLGRLGGIRRQMQAFLPGSKLRLRRIQRSPTLHAAGKSLSLCLSVSPRKNVDDDDCPGYIYGTALDC